MADLEPDRIAESVWAGLTPPYRTIVADPLAMTFLSQSVPDP